MAGSDHDRYTSTLARDFIVEVEMPTKPTITLTGTAEADTDQITLATGALTNGQRVLLADGPARAGGPFYVVGFAAGVFGLAETAGGTPVQLNDGPVTLSYVDTAAAPVLGWAGIRALTSFKPEFDNNTEDDSDFDGEGYQSSAKTSIGWSLELGLGRKVSRITNGYDPAQEYLRAQSERFTPDDEVRVRWYDRAGRMPAKVGWASPGWSQEGESHSDLATATVTLSGQGKLEEEPNPAATPAP